MICPACLQSDVELHPAEYSLVPGWHRYKCLTCIKGNMEPRFSVVLAALLKERTDYMHAITEYSYYGDPIEASEIMPSD